MADTPDEAASESQAHGCSSYPLSFPSQPPDIRNWFSSYEYESPEAPELVADPGGDNGSETQDPLEYRVPGTSLLKQDPQDGGNALRGCCFRDHSGHEASAIRESSPIGRSSVEPSAKRKQSLRQLFGAGFLEDHKESTETENLVVLAVQRNAVEPLSDCNAAGLPDTKRSHEGSVEHSKQPVDCDGIGLADTQECLPGCQETEHSRLPVNCDGTDLGGTEENFPEDGIGHSKLPAIFHSRILADTEKSSKEDGIEHSLLPVNFNGFGSAGTEESFPRDKSVRANPTLECKNTEATVAADGFVAIKIKGKPAEECRMNKIHKSSTGREKATLQDSHNVLKTKVLVQESTRSPLADRTNFSGVAGAPTPELCGKWKCPRKGKPYVGPPLKQLRLEQWVRRAN